MNKHTQHIATGVQSLKGNEILAMIQQTEEGTMVAIRPLCCALRIDPKRQYEKVQSDCRFNHRHMPMVGADGKIREMLCLPAEQVPMWINLINSNKVSEEKRQALLDLHKFFGYALNEFSRGRYITKEQYEADQMVMRNQLAKAMELLTALIKENEELKQENRKLAKANGFRASSASYQMHARKAELKH